MNDPIVLSTREDHVLLVTLDNAAEHNCMSPLMFEALNAAFTDATRQKDIRCVVITGSGDTFCGGADLHKGFIAPGTTLPVIMLN